jgi:iron complex outermembrane receptor protein
MVFLTRILNPLIGKVDTLGDGNTRGIHYYTADGHIQGVGLETSLKASYRGANLFMTYTLQDQSREINGVKSISPLTSKHTLAMLASYDWKGRLIFGLDAYYWSPQEFSDGTPTRGIWEMGVNMQVVFKWVVVFANFENLLDVRQSKFSRIVSPSPSYHTPRFAEIYAPLEGRILNVGFKLKLAEFIKKGK